jgi:ABC-type bacteriocin/lantibiotic exporter with double-glycine peptidase domain
MYVQLTDSMKKIHGFYTSDEVQSNIVRKYKDDKDPNALTLKGDFSWGFEKQEEEDEEKSKDDKEAPKKESTKKLESIMTLKDMDLEIKKGEFVIIVGAVGSGKSSILNSVFGDMLYVPKQEIEFAGGLEKELSKNEYEGLKASLFDLKIKEGQEPVQVNGSISYVEQQSWTQNMTLRNNVLFGREFDKHKYVETMMACQLESDLRIMPAGDLTEIGEKGINLSGGQKARVSLARAVY